VAAPDCSGHPEITLQQGVVDAVEDPVIDEVDVVRGQRISELTELVLTEKHSHVPAIFELINAKLRCEAVSDSTHSANSSPFRAVSARDPAGGDAGPEEAMSFGCLEKAAEQ
jgi:hypothetical protein